MKTGPQETPRFKKVKLDVLIALIALVVIIAGVVIYTGNHNQPAKSATDGWVHYASQKYGFQFDYPGSWGKPSVTQDKGQSGSHYSIVFSNPKITDKRSIIVNIAMDSEDYQRKVCPDGQCSVISSVITGKDIQSDLKNNAKAFVSHDTSSYGFITNVIGNGTTLHEEQIVVLPSIKVSAASANLSISNTSSCPQNKFASSNQPTCVNQNDYTTLNNVLKSLKSV